jgi:hypothetical protein
MDDAEEVSGDRQASFWNYIKTITVTSAAHGVKWRATRSGGKRRRSVCYIDVQETRR